MSDESQKTIQALAYFDLLDARRKELSAYADGLVGITVDDLLLEAFELGDDMVENEIVHAAFVLRAEQNGQGCELRNTAKVLRRIKRKADGQPRKAIAQIAAVLVCVIAISGITVGAAYAFNWTALMRIFDPVAEVFGIVINSPPSNILKTDADLSQNPNHDWSQVPRVFGGHPSLLEWVPARYEPSYHFANSEDADVKMLMCVFDSTQGELIYTLHVFESLSADFMYEIEKDKASGKVISLAGYEVTLTNNIDYTIALWENGNAAYKINGIYSEEELEKMIKSLMGV